MKLPTFRELPRFEEFSGCAWEVWNAIHKPNKDQLGTVNLLTPNVVQRAAKEEIRTGKTVSLNWPINFPEKAMFRRQDPHIESVRWPGTQAVTDDIIHINTQSGTQWDGLKHFGLVAHNIYYNNTHANDIQIGRFSFPNPTELDSEENRNVIKLGIHNWAQHGICGRGVLLDLVKFYTESGSPLPYDPWTSHGINEEELKACAKKQGVEFRQGDILILRVGFMQRFNKSSQSERDELYTKPETFAGIEQSEEMKEFLWDNHFAAIASDQPALEAWPPKAGIGHLHQTLLGMWGMPIGEFFDLEKLSKMCAETCRYTFFFSSWPLNVLGGVASPPNAAEYF
jgi:kynurenine formamidase